MSRTIPFVHTLSQEEECAWIAAFDAALPDVSIRPLTELSDREAAAADVAIVANPNPADLDRLPALVWVQSLWAGVERLVPHVPSHVAIVRMTDPQLAATMAEAVLAWTLYLHRDMPRYARQQRQRLWRQHDSTTPQLRCVGILGLGAMGQAASRRLLANDFRVVGWSRSPRSVAGVEASHGADGLSAVLESADILVILLPLTPATRNLIDANALSRMKRGASLINFGRGAIIDDEALLARLDDGSLDHAVLDVFAVEPLPSGSPIWTNDRVTVLPHISAPTSIASASRVAADNLRTYLLEGRTPAPVDRDRGY